MAAWRGSTPGSCARASMSRRRNSSRRNGPTRSSTSLAAGSGGSSPSAATRAAAQRAMADPSPSSRRGWPARLVEIADLIGDAAALRLVAAFGGLRIYIPAQPKPDQALWQAVGESAAHLLAERYGSAEVE